MTTPHLGGLYSELILASTSSARRALLTSLGLPFRAEAPGVDETPPPGITSTRQLVMLLAERKARAIAKLHPQALVIGSDQLVDLDGVALGKPANLDAARAQLQQLSGRSHEILTGVCVLGPGYLSTEVDVARLTLYRLQPDELERYLQTDEWQGCAGGYRVESLGQALFQNVEGDRTSVQGLPMSLVVRLLREAGVSFFHR